MCNIDVKQFDDLIVRLRAIGAFVRGPHADYSLEDLLVRWCAIYLNGTSVAQVIAAKFVTVCVEKKNNSRFSFIGRWSMRCTIMTLHDSISAGR